MDTALRSIPLDGARLWFDRSSGLNVRVDSPATRSLKQAAPRTVLFGITNACNLTCGFCSRDPKAPSHWTPERAFQTLKAFEALGVLEVAFGGGEPLVFRGFDELLARLDAETSLALNVTTNGALLTPERALHLAAHAGEVRVSLYDDNPWRSALTTLAAAGARTGANVIVDRTRLHELPALLAELPSLGCHDVALLRFIGHDASKELTPAELRSLSSIVREAPVRVRLSTCFANTLSDVPRLFAASDCGAGSDFVTVTSDQKLKACSFHHDAMPFESAEHAISLWRERRERLSRRAPFVGCARPVGGTTPFADGVRVWQGFSANNSGDCVLVGRFAEASAAQNFVERIASVQLANTAYTPELIALLASEGITAQPNEHAPEGIAAAGRNVLLHTGSALEDEFPSLRTLLWRSGGVAVLNRIHEHESMQMIEALGFDDAQALKEASDSLAIPHHRAVRRGLTLFVASPCFLPGGDSLPVRQAPRTSAELVVGRPQVVDDALIKAVARPVPDASRQWIFASFRDAVPDALKSQQGVIAGRFALFEASRGGTHAGTKATRLGGLATVITTTAVRFRVFFGADKHVKVDTAALQNELRIELGPDAKVELPIIETTRPDRVLRPLVDFAQGRNLKLWLTADPVDALAATLSRLDADVAASR
ncbi:MAG: radical SAM protein [Archangium sp.]|nr:radical SAM protein [Archangium sp.]